MTMRVAQLGSTRSIVGSVMPIQENVRLGRLALTCPGQGGGLCRGSCTKAATAPLNLLCVSPSLSLHLYLAERSLAVGNVSGSHW